MFEQLRQRWSSDNRQPRNQPLEIASLTPPDVSRLNLSWDSHFNSATLRQHLSEFPGISFYTKDQHDFVIGDWWRRRDDIGHILETQARRYRPELVARLVQQFEELNCGAVVVSTDEQNDRTGFYTQQGFEEIERIIYYEKLDMRTDFSYQGETLNMVQYTPALMPDLLYVDHASFPWLWWNSQPEFEYYVAQPEVTLYLAYTQSLRRPVGYFGFTLFERWSHLDRLAVVSDLQSRGAGAYQLAYAFDLMRKRGARRCTLSTQGNNFRSQRLYEGFGFRRVRSLEYSIVGKWLKPRQQLEK